jgi:hypothetical protein
MAVDSDMPRVAPPKLSTESDVRDKIASAMRRLDKEQRLELIHFVDDRLAGDADDKTLARTFDDGHTYIVWRSAGGPRRRLELIRDIAQTEE